MYKLSKLAAGSVVAATAAFASAGFALADRYVPRGKVVYERPADWSGFYFGLHSGYQWSSIDVSFPDFGTRADVDHDSFLVGGHIGIQHQFGAVVLGVEGNLDSTFRNNPGSTPCPAAGLTCTSRVNDILSVGGRIGWAAGHWMPYVTGGYASAGVPFRAAATAPFPFLATEDGYTRNHGWYIGGGFEWQVSPGWTAGLEYRHYDFGADTSTTWTAQAPQGIPVERLRQDLTTDSITARVSWRFGRPEPAPLK
jgi:outer membrane immunogenic protein